MLKLAAKPHLYPHPRSGRSTFLFECWFLLAEDVDLRMAKLNRPDQPAWQRNAIFEFFSSLKLAVVLLAVLIAGAIVGTLYESSFDAQIARTYVYDTPWFNCW